MHRRPPAWALTGFALVVSGVCGGRLALGFRLAGAPQSEAFGGHQMAFYPG